MGKVPRNKAKAPPSPFQVSVRDPKWNGDHAVYRLFLKHVESGVEVMSIRRYTEFAVVLRSLGKRSAVVPPCPPKKWFGNKSSSLLKKRAALFQQCLTSILQLPRVRQARNFQALTGFPLLRERRRALGLLVLSCRRVCFQWWTAWLLERRQRKKLEQLCREHEARVAEGQLDSETAAELQELAKELREMLNEPESVRPMEIVTLVKNKLSRLERTLQEQGTVQGDARAASLEESIINLSRLACGVDTMYSTGESAIVALSAQVEKLRQDAQKTDALKAELSTERAKQLKFEIISGELTKLASRVKGELVEVEDAIVVLDTEIRAKDLELQNLSVKMEQHRENIQKKSEETEELLSRERAMSLQNQITTISKQLMGQNKSSFGVEKAVILDYEDTGKTTYFSIEVVGCDGSKWTCRRRYKMFDKLRKRLGASAKGVAFPSKAINVGERKLKERMSQLNSFLLVCISKAHQGDAACQVELSAFLRVGENACDRGDDDDDDDLDDLESSSVSVQGGAPFLTAPKY